MAEKGSKVKAMIQVDALIEYVIATLDFYRDTGALQVRPDGMWREGPDIPVSSIRTTTNMSTGAK